MYFSGTVNLFHASEMWPYILDAAYALASDPIMLLSLMTKAVIKKKLYFAQHVWKQYIGDLGHVIQLLFGSNSSYPINSIFPLKNVEFISRYFD